MNVIQQIIKNRSLSSKIIKTTANHSHFVSDVNPQTNHSVAVAPGELILKKENHPIEQINLCCGNGCNNCVLIVETDTHINKHLLDPAQSNNSQ